MRKLILTAAATAALATSSGGVLLAQDGPPQLPGQMDVSRVEAGTYKTDPNHSLLSWRINHFGFNDYIGLFGDIDATLTLDPANLEGAKVEAMIPINPIVASAGLHDHLLRAGKDGGKPDFFGPDQPAAKFVSTKVEATGGTSANITGDLTLNGVTKPVVIAAEFTGAGNSMMGNKKTVGFEGRTTIKRSDWGLTSFAPMVSDEVELNITMAFEKQ